MNEVYFACITCKTLVDAGYRWAYWALEDPGTVTRRGLVTPAAILADPAYWNPSEPATRLRAEIFPRVRAFFAAHSSHEIRYGEEDDFVSFDDTSFLEWLELGPIARYTPRYFCEVMELQSWSQVESWADANPDDLPGWWHDPQELVAARRFFDTLCQR